MRQWLWGTSPAFSIADAWGRGRVLPAQQKEGVRAGTPGMSTALSPAGRGDPGTARGWILSGLQL